MFHIERMHYINSRLGTEFPLPTKNAEAVLHGHHDDAIRYHGLEPMVVQGGAHVVSAAVNEHHNGQGFFGAQGVLWGAIKVSLQSCHCELDCLCVSIPAFFKSSLGS